MRDVLRFPLADGGEIAIDAVDVVGQEQSGMGRAGLGDSAARAASRAAARASMTYDQALDGVRRAADATMRQFARMATRPSEVEVEFSVRLSADAGAVITSVAAEAQLRVRLMWCPQPVVTNPPDANTTNPGDPDANAPDPRTPEVDARHTDPADPVRARAVDSTVA